MDMQQEARLRFSFGRNLILRKLRAKPWREEKKKSASADAYLVYI